MRSKNSKTLSVGQDMVSCIVLDESMEFIKLERSYLSQLWSAPVKQIRHHENVSNILQSFNKIAALIRSQEYIAMSLYEQDICGP